MYSSINYSQEELNLYNPAFCGYLLLTAIRSYQEERDGGIDYPLIYLCLPIVLTLSTRSRLPHSYTTPIATWIAANEDAIIGFPKITSSFVSITKSALSFLLQCNAVEIMSDGGLNATATPVNKTSIIFKNNQELKSVYAASRMIGKWFAHGSTTETIYANFGIRP